MVRAKAKNRSQAVSNQLNVSTCLRLSLSLLRRRRPTTDSASVAIEVDGGVDVGTYIYVARSVS
jgi:hypothetical protein